MPPAPSGRRIVSRPMVPKIVDIQRRVALAEGCAFFDTYLAMGGEGAAGRWHRGSPRLVIFAKTPEKGTTR